MIAIAPAQRSSAGIRSTATGREKDRRLYGAAVRADSLAADSRLRKAVIADCGWITPEIDFKWNALEWQRDAWWFKRADALVDFAKMAGQKMRGHTLLWDQSTPDWAKADMSDRRDWALVERWFATALGRYGSAACEWDVVNEPIDTEHGDRSLRKSCFQRAFGNDYVARALHLARRHAPGARLMINEYGLDYGNSVERDRRTALLKLVESLRRREVPLDGIGVQAHLDLSKGPLDTKAVTAMLREIAGMGLSITITELDVKEANRTLSLEERDRAIDDEVRRYLDIVLAEPAVRGVVSWGVSDRDSWLQTDITINASEDLNRGLPLDSGMRPKPLYWTLRKSIGSARYA